VQKMESKALSDGNVTKQEKRRIEHAQDQQNKKIRRERHDKQNPKVSRGDRRSTCIVSCYRAQIPKTRYGTSSSP